MARYTPITKSSAKPLEEDLGISLTFSLSREAYGIGSLKLKEIIDMVAITPVPYAPSYLKGVIGYKGSVIPVVDLRSNYEKENDELSENASIIIVEIDNQVKDVLMGIIVNSATDLYRTGSTPKNNHFQFGAHMSTNYVLGMVASNGEVKILLDMDRIINNSEIDILNLGI